MLFSIRREFFVIHSFTPPFTICYPCLFPPLRPLDAHHAHFSAFVRASARIHFTRYTPRLCWRSRQPPIYNRTPPRLIELFCGVHPHYNARRPEKSSIFAKFFMFCTLHKKQADFLCNLTVGLSRAAPIHYIYITRRACPALAIKNFNRFPLCYYYIESIRFCQVFQESFTFPNMTDCTNTKCSIHSERPGHSEHSRQSRCQVFSPSSLYSRAKKLKAIAYIAPAKSWQLLHQQKNERYTYI